MNLESKLKAQTTSETIKNIENFIQQDPGKRGLDEWAISENLFPGTLSLAKGDHIIIATGFYILNSKVIETDGPPGAIVLAEALIKMGKSVTIIVDDHGQSIMSAGLKSINCNAQLLTFSPGKEIDIQTVVKKNTTHFIALERPGIAADGFHHNFRGQIISEYVAPTDNLFIKCTELGIITLAIGDGGNELGMGNIKSDNIYCCTIKSDYCICAGVSNWAGYAIAGILSILEKQNLMISFEQFNKILKTIVDNGAVDGVSGKPEVTVDGLDIKWENHIYSSLLELAKG